MKMISMRTNLPFVLALTACLSAQTAQPKKQHRLLARLAGIWNAEIDYIDFNTGKPAKSKGTSIRRQPLGELWLVENFQASIMGTPIKGMSTTGYDPIKKKLVGTWVDSMSPHMMIVEGNWDEAGKVMTLSGMGVGADGRPAKNTYVWTIQDENRHVFEHFTRMPDGKDVKIVTMTMTRRTRTMDEVRKE